MLDGMKPTLVNVVLADLFMKNFAFEIGHALGVFHTKISKAAALIVTGGSLCVASTTVQAVVFTSAVPITVSDTNNGTPPGALQTPGAPYPGTLLVSGLQNSITSITLTINGFNAVRSDDVDMLLVSPGGRTLIVFSDVGSTTLSSSGLTITLSDAAASFLPDNAQLTSGTFKPTNESTQQDTFPLAGMVGGPPAGPYGNPGGLTAGVQTGIGFGSQFRFTNPNGTWSLYILDDTTTGSVGAPELSGITGWSLDIIAVPEPGTWALLAAGGAAMAYFLRRRLQPA